MMGKIFAKKSILLRGVPAQPDGGEVPPAELPHHVVAAVEQVADLDRVVTA